MKEFLKEKYTSWQEGLLMESDPVKRIEYLKAGIEEDPSPQNKWHLQLLTHRYADKNGQISKADYFMASWMDIKTVPRIAKLPFSKKRAHAMLMDAASKLLLLEDKSSWEDWQLQLLQGEYEHLIKYYISLCQDDRTYTGLVMGFINMKDEKIREKLLKDINQIVIDTPQAMGEEAVFAPLKKALHNII